MQRIQRNWLVLGGLGIVVVALVVLAVLVFGGSDYWEASGQWEGEPVFTQNDVEGGGVTEEAANELEACGFDSSEDARLTVTNALPSDPAELQEAVITGSGGTLEVEGTQHGVSVGEDVAVGIYRVNCLSGGS